MKKSKASRKSTSSKPLALLLENLHPLAEESLERAGFAVESYKDSLDGKQLESRIKDASLLGIRSKTKINSETLKAAPKLLTIGAFCIGTEQIDLNAASNLGIAVFNAPYSNTRSVVEIVLAEIVMLLRKVFQSSAAFHRGLWVKSASGCYEARGKKLGIVGYGNIGSQLSVLAESMGMEVFYYDVVEKLSLGKAQKCRSLPELLQKVDVVSMHVDGRAENVGLIGARQFALMKPGAIFINFSRGKIVDLKALKVAITSGKLSGAGIDVFPEEPKGSREKVKNDLCGLEQVILTPHIGGSTSEAQRNIAEFVSSRFIDYVQSGISYGSVNFPQIQAHTVPRAHRLLHVHHNVPGILAQINGLLAVNRINILGQYLKTNEKIGYVITDVNRKYSTQVIEELKAIPYTIKFRVLS